MPRTNSGAPSQSTAASCELDQLLLDAVETLRLARRTLYSARRELEETDAAISTKRRSEARDNVVSAEEFYLDAKSHYDDVIDVLIETSHPASSRWLPLMGDIQPPNE